MLRIHTNIQLSFLDPFEFLGPKRKEMLEGGWAYLFREFLYMELPVDAIQSAFHTSLERPTTVKVKLLNLCFLLSLFSMRLHRNLALFILDWFFFLSPNADIIKHAGVIK